MPLIKSRIDILLLITFLFRFDIRSLNFSGDEDVQGVKKAASNCEYFEAELIFVLRF